MRKLALLGVCTLLFLGLSSQAQADWKDFDHHKAKDKLKRGFVNILSSPMEIPKQIRVESEEHGVSMKNAGLPVLGGLVKGVAMTFGRIGSGLWDVATFNLNYPDNFEPLMKPDFVFDQE